jgi:multidrug efflux system membrane fusion protein
MTDTMHTHGPTHGHAFGFVSLLALSLGCSQSRAPAEKPLRPVRVFRVTPAAGVATRTFSGTAKAGSESRLSFKVPGSLRELAVKVGDRVKRGAPIAQLDERDFRMQLSEAQAALGQALAQARNAQADYERIRRLYENRSASLKDLDATRAAADSGRASVAAARQRVNMARSQLDYCSLNAPVDGEIASVPVELNENVKAGATVAVLNSGARPEVAIAVPESLIVKVTRGDRATVRFDALADRRFPALVTEVGVTTSGDTTFPVTVQLTEPQARVRAGMAAEVTIEFGNVDVKKRTFVPSHTVMEDDAGRFVFVAKPAKADKTSAAGRGADGTTNPQGGQRATIERRAVRIGSLSSDGIEIVEGLSAGDLVVDSGLRFVEPQMAVRILHPAG